MTQIRPQDFLSIPTVPATLPNLFPKLNCPLSSLSKAESRAQISMHRVI